MPQPITMPQAQALYSDFTFVKPLPASMQKTAFHVRNQAGEDLCLKIISPDYNPDRLEREIQALTLIQHTNIARLRGYKHSISNGQSIHYVLEDYIEGTDLTDQLTGQPWNLNRAQAFFIELCDGLIALSTENIVHRDLKPSNIRVTTTQQPVIIDFGLIRVLNLSSITATIDGAHIGTPAWFAPEQFTGTRNDVDCRTDLFALGILMYQAVVGYHPFYTNGMAYNDLKDAVCNSNACITTSEFQQLPRRWQLVIERLLKKHRVERPHNATQVRAMLDKL